MPSIDDIAAVPDGVETFSTWKEVTVVYHEGVPGHHLQISHAMADGESLNRWQRMSWVSGHVDASACRVRPLHTSLVNGSGYRPGRTP